MAVLVTVNVNGVTFDRRLFYMATKRNTFKEFDFREIVRKVKKKEIEMLFAKEVGKHSNLTKANLKSFVFALLEEVFTDSYAFAIRIRNIKITNNMRELGSFNYNTGTLSISYLWATMGTVEELVDTILHEVAHAITPFSAHGPRWETACKILGCKPEELCRRRIVVHPKYVQYLHFKTSSFYTAYHRKIKVKNGVLKTYAEFAKEFPQYNAWEKDGCIHRPVIQVNHTE